MIEKANDVAGLEEALDEIEDESFEKEITVTEAISCFSSHLDSLNDPQPSLRTLREIASSATTAFSYLCFDYLKLESPKQDIEKVVADMHRFANLLVPLAIPLNEKATSIKSILKQTRVMAKALDFLALGQIAAANRIASTLTDLTPGRG